MYMCHCRYVHTWRKETAQKETQSLQYSRHKCAVHHLLNAPCLLIETHTGCCIRCLIRSMSLKICTHSIGHKIRCMKENTICSILKTHMHSGPPNAPCLSIVTHIEGTGGRGRGEEEVVSQNTKEILFQRAGH